ncbi:hypothetical protein OTK49_02950 [Vibrio coralliirubri]|uniref:hypothetical protein n=1 Tax=Vibrio coralliirubri TaxID=1516159 RepID=UPI002283E981|nr:hypothetical protein [Vibrio coralliirubri]MCY9861473.1 hypothetical protein [Vibrio coralliirubri]
MNKGYSQDEYLEQILNKQILSSELPRGYLSQSDELAARQAAKRLQDQSAPYPPAFKQNKFMEEMNFSREMEKGSTNLKFSEATSGVNWGKTMAFVGKHSLGVGLATMVAGGGIGLVASVAATYAVSTVTKKAVFLFLEQIGVMGVIREALTGLLKKLANFIKFDKIKEISPTLGKAALCVAAAAVLTVALTTGAEASDLIDLGSTTIADAPTQVSNVYSASIGSDLPSLPPSPELTEAINKALASVPTDLEGSPDAITQQKALVETVLNSTGAPESEVKNFTTTLSNNQGFAGLMERSGGEIFKDFENVSSMLETQEVKGEFSLFTDAPDADLESAPEPTTQPEVAPAESAPAEAAPAEAAPAESAPAPEATPEFQVESLNPVELPVEHSVWRTYETYIESQGIEFASDAEANDAYVHYMQEIARLNPEIESIHNVDKGQILKFPEITNLQTAQAAVDDIEFTAKDNVLSTHTPTEGMVASEKARIAAELKASNPTAPEVTVAAPEAPKAETATTASAKMDQAESAPAQAAITGSELTKEMKFTAMSTELYEARTGQSVGFIFEDDVNDKAEIFAEHLVSKIDQSNYSQIEKDFAKAALADSISNNTSVAMANEGILNAPSSFTDLDMARFASSVDDEYVGKWVLEHGKTYNEANFYMDNQGIVRNAKSIEQVAASIAQELHDKGDVDMTHKEVAEAYSNILDSIKAENGVTGNDVEVEKIKIPTDMQSDLKSERIVQVREQHETRHTAMRR